MDLDIHKENVKNNLEDQDCPVCLQKYNHPTKLPCGHVFCFLCVKGIAIQSKKCAMCRKQIPSDYLDHPVLLGSLPSDEISTECNNEEHQWYYEGRNGWWKYDERSNTELESAFNNGQSECMLLLAGTIYCVDFQNMLQLRRNDPTRRRRVRRDVPSLPSKGIAGIKKIEYIQEQHEVSETTENETNSSVELLTEDTETNADETVNNHNESDLSPSNDVDYVIATLSNITIANPNEMPSTVEEEEDT